MNKLIFKKLAIGLLTVSLALFAPISVNATGKLDVTGGANSARGNNQPGNLFGAGGIFQQITNILLFLIGVLSVIMMIIGGMRYVLSGGNKDAVTSAKNTILYAIVGLIVAILAFAIVDFVIRTFTNTGGGGTDI